MQWASDRTRNAEFSKTEGKLMVRKLLAKTLTSLALGAIAFGSASTGAWAQDRVKIGLILPMTGPFTSTGKQIDAAVRLYMQQNGQTVAGKRVEVILKDD